MDMVQAPNVTTSTLAIIHYIEQLAQWRWEYTPNKGPLVFCFLFLRVNTFQEFPTRKHHIHQPVSNLLGGHVNDISNDPIPMYSKDWGKFANVLDELLLLFWWGVDGRSLLLICVSTARREPRTAKDSTKRGHREL